MLEALEAESQDSHVFLKNLTINGKLSFDDRPKLTGVGFRVKSGLGHGVKCLGFRVGEVCGLGSSRRSLEFIV